MIEYLLVALVAAAIGVASNKAIDKFTKLIERRNLPKKSKVRIPQQVVVVDASNVALYGPKPSKKGRIENLLLVIRTLEERGFKVYAIADASLRHKIDRPDILEKLIEKGKVLQAPAGTPADYFILSIADAEYGVVISNDVFKEWRGSFPWVNDRNRVIKYLIAGNRVYFFPDIRPKKKYKHKGEKALYCIDLEEKRKDREDSEFIYVM